MNEMMCPPIPTTSATAAAAAAATVDHVINNDDDNNNNNGDDDDNYDHNYNNDNNDNDDDDRKLPAASSFSRQQQPVKRQSPRLLKMNPTTTTTTTTAGNYSYSDSPSSHYQQQQQSYIPNIHLPCNAPHIYEKYILSIMICYHNNDDDHYHTTNTNNNNNTTNTAAAHYRWCIHEGDTYLPIKIWRTKLFDITEIESYEQQNDGCNHSNNNNNNTPELFFLYIPDEVRPLLFTDHNDDDEENINNSNYTCYQNQTTTTTTATTTTPKTKRRKTTLNHKKNKFNMYIPPLWRPNTITTTTTTTNNNNQISSHDLYRYRSYYFQIPILSIYVIFPHHKHFSNDNNNTTTIMNTTTQQQQQEEVDKMILQLYHVAERGLQCMFQNVIPCKLYRIYHDTTNSTTTIQQQQQQHDHNNTFNNNNNSHLPSNDPILSSWSNYYNLNIIAMQSILNTPNPLLPPPTTTTTTTTPIMTQTQTTTHTDGTKTIRTLPSLPQPLTLPQRNNNNHYFLFINGGSNKTTCTTYNIIQNNDPNNNDDDDDDDDDNDPKTTTFDNNNNNNNNSSMIVTSTLKCQHVSLLQQCMDLHESTGALPLITREDIMKDILLSLQTKQKPRSTTATTNSSNETMIPFFVTQNTKSAMMGTLLRTYILTLHHTIKTWVYSIWDDATKSAVGTGSTTTGRHCNNNDNVFTPPSVTTNDVIVTCCITGVEFDMILQLLQLSSQQLFDHLDLICDPDLSWTSPNQNKIYFSNNSNSNNTSFSTSVPPYMYHSTVLGLPQQYITVRRLKMSTHQETNDISENQMHHDAEDGTEHPPSHPPDAAFVSDDEADQAIQSKKESLEYEYITVAIYKQKHFLLYGLQYLLYQNSRIRNHALILEDGNNELKENDDDGMNGKEEENKSEKNDHNTKCSAIITTPPTMEYLRQRMYGCRIAKYFGNEIYIGYVASIDNNSDDKEDNDVVLSTKHSLTSDLFNVKYDDGDEEDMSIHELYEHLEFYLELMNDHDLDDNVEQGANRVNISNARYIYTQLKVVLFPPVSKVVELSLECINNNDSNNIMSTESNFVASVDRQNTIDEENIPTHDEDIPKGHEQLDDGNIPTHDEDTPNVVGQVKNDNHDEDTPNDNGQVKNDNHDDDTPKDNGQVENDISLNIQEIVNEGIDQTVQALLKSKDEENEKALDETAAK